MDSSRRPNASRFDHDPSEFRRWTDARPAEEDSDDRPPNLDREDVVLLLAPTALAGVYGLVGAAGNATLFDTGQPWPGSALAFALLGALFVLATLATVRLYDDATARDGVGDWNPNPWAYIAAGALVLVLAHLLRSTLAGGTVRNPVPVYAGTLVVALLVSSVVAGPVYLVQRVRHTDGTEQEAS